MEINSLLTGDLWFRFSDEEMYWCYSLIGNWNSIFWFSKEGIIYKKDLEVLE